MASGSLLALLDDIATLLDDISVMSKVATQKTAGVLGDDLAVNAEQVSGVRAAREIPVVLAVAKGSMINKVIIVPLILALSFFLPWLITPLLVAGGLFLCYEGAEKVWHKLAHPHDKDHSQAKALIADSKADLRKLEEKKIKGAIRTDFILSLEIIVIALSTMSDYPFAKQAVALAFVAFAMTILVYGLVAAIVKLDDLGLYLAKGKALAARVGQFLLWLAPMIMKLLTIVGTIAMFLVGGGILTHSAEAVVDVDHLMQAISTGLAWLDAVVPTLVNGVIGLFCGALLVAAHGLLAPLWSGKGAAS
ncbi:DUF808 domain-containing protein [Ketobacter sp.]|uniref:DUF808 domain-containing protein n=1 Tax=Ketobacter sp. TaxID=2083498 RepID=UPI000F176D98|nr:DUF808 domain-containing protein [Ketobacter sp.]RLT92198.1 MAG: DUF808 domain-containing protein [Ketobacter sp.]